MLSSWPLALSIRGRVNEEKIALCARDNRPPENTLQTVELTSTDRLGNELVRRATVYRGNATCLLIWVGLCAISNEAN